MRRVAVVLVVAVGLTAVDAASIRAEDSDWPTSINSNADVRGPNEIDYPITFPLAAVADGFVTGTPTVDAADGFCYNLQPRNYSTYWCIQEAWAHRGQDFSPLNPSSLIGTATYAGFGVMPVLAPAGGPAEISGCVDGNGNTVRIKVGYDLRFQLQHMSGLTYAVNSIVPDGRRIGFANATKVAPCTGQAYSAPHLHIELRLPPQPGIGESTYYDPVDPWISLRTAYARPGLWAGGIVDTAMRDVWVFVANAYGPAAVGFPSIRESIGSNVQWRASFSTSAAVQYLANGLSTYDATNMRTGALVHILGAPGASWIRNAWFKKWLAMGEQNSYLGFPIASDNGVRQNFQGGCIKIVNGTAVAAAYGAYPCT